ncbi:NADH-quinone oxidoreductase subunit N [Alloacidobacterium dinghuense]|uniref:NADH-quinone oxidoreductase subunit N n=1 Tax=Alloacidobacterium dinghuense TaxID=2763107 RepID=A0A7G8BM79_9BACT|nr:NADH-quinone oxidoreductase subunit N [Alloacidobacterium dinghuense]QNI33649.1 NADH-quinone oxidoreductase subunit N [Alloacidobacterium dinghuense]
MTDVPQLYRILPEVILTITGVIVMLAEPLLAKESSRKPLGWLSVLGTLAALVSSFWQLQLPAGTAFFGTVQTDAFSVFFHVVIAGIVLATLLATLDAATPDTEGLGELFALICLGAVGMMLMTSAVELLLVFIGLEISSISTYIMAGFRRKSAKGPEAALKYFLLGSFATAFTLYGIALIFGATGTTDIGKIAGLLTTSQTPILATIGVAMILIGLGFKVSAAPFQVWTPDVYEGAPAAVVALMSTAPKAAAFAVLLRVLFVAFPALHNHWQPLIWWMAALSMTIGNLGALRQQNVKRMLAYSSIAHAGYLLVAFTALSPDGIAAASFYTLSYAAMNVGIFVVLSHAGGMNDRLTLIQDYRGLAYRSPLLGATMAFFLISLIGIPFTGGFFGKFYVFASALHSGLVWLTIIGLVNSGIAAYYYLRVVATAYSKPVHSDLLDGIPRASVPLLFALLLTVAATLILGIAPGRVLALAKAGANTLSLPGATTASK